jgi:hypothetical protein
MNQKIPNESANLTSRESEDWLQIVREKVAHLKFGSIQITVHDGRVTQVESIERTRFSTERKSKD